MKKIVSLILVLALCLGVTVVLGSCSRAPKDDGAQISVYLGEEVYDFDPTDYYVNSNAEQLMSLLFEPLFRINEKGKLENAAASGYEVNEEERTIVIQIGESYWSDDVQLKAADYIYAWRELILDPNNANPAAALFYDIENAVQVKNGEKSIYDFGAVASDVYEITITYREGADYKQILRNLASVASSPAREDIVSTAPNHWTKLATSNVSNGPFKLGILDYDSAKFTLLRNRGYHQNSRAVNYTKEVTPGTLVSFLNGAGEDIELTYDDIVNKTVFYMLDASLDMRAEAKDNATCVDDLSTYTYVFNTENPLFKNAKVRYALSIALDRTAMAEAAVFAKPAESFVSSAIADTLYDELERPISAKADIARAREILAGVDLTDIPMSFTLTVNDDEESLKLANLAKNAWRELGFTVTVKAIGTVSTTVYDQNMAADISITDSGIQALVKNASYGSRAFDVIAVDWQMYSEDAFVALSSFSSYMSGNGKDFATGAYRTNISGWWTSRYDVAITKAYLAKTPEERLEALRAAEAILLESCPVIPVLYNQSFSFASEDISDVEIDGYGNFIFTKMEQEDYELYLPAPDEGDDEGEEEEVPEKETEE